MEYIQDHPKASRQEILAKLKEMEKATNIGQYRAKKGQWIMEFYYVTSEKTYAQAYYINDMSNEKICQRILKNCTGMQSYAKWKRKRENQ